VTKKALVLIGGGVRGAFQIGILQHLLKRKGEQFDIVTGTSVGALNGAFLSQYNKADMAKGIDRLEDLWRSIDNESIRTHWSPFSYLHALWSQSLYNSKPLRDLIDQSLDEDKIRASDVELSVLAVSLKTGDAKHFDGKHPEIKTAVKASSAFPVFFEPVKLAGELYVDGGARESAPLSRAIALGADHLTIINTGPLMLGEALAENLKTFGIALRCFDIHSVEIMNNDLDRFLTINQKLKDGRLSSSSPKRIIKHEFIGPDYELSADPLDFSPRKIKNIIQAGYDKATKLWPAK